MSHLKIKAEADVVLVLVYFFMYISVSLPRLFNAAVYVSSKTPIVTFQKSVIGEEMTVLVGKANLSATVIFIASSSSCFLNILFVFQIQLCPDFRNQNGQ